MVNRRIQGSRARVGQSVHNGFVFAALGVSEFLWWWQLSKNEVMHNIMSIEGSEFLKR